MPKKIYKIKFVNKKQTEKFVKNWKVLLMRKFLRRRRNLLL